jgi:enoyl-CoA hydratase
MADQSADPPVVHYEVEGAVAVITIDRPEARHAINRDVSAGIEAALDRLETTDGVWAAVLRSTPTSGNPIFCAGADLKAINSGDARGIHTKKGGFGGIVFRDRTKPIVVAVDGLATAGGCEIVLACDIVVASTRSAFGLAEVKRNLVANAGGLYRLPRALGPSVAMEMALTGEPLPAQRAYDLGMVSRLVEPDDVLPTAMQIASTIAANGPLSVQATRRIVANAFAEDDEALRHMGLEASRRMFDTEDTAEGVRAFVEKRPPRWTGR